MDYFKFSRATELSKYINYDSTGKKFGEKVATVVNLDQLKTNDAEFVLFGIPDLSNSKDKFKLKDCGMFQTVLENLLNIQQNQFNHGENLVVLGEVDVEMITKASYELETNSEKKERCKEILKKTISDIVHAICSLGKLPIVIGGHHESTLDILKGVGLAQNMGINLLEQSTQINLNVEEDFDKLERTKGNPELLNKYNVFGLHKNYVTEEQLKLMKSSKKLNFHLYEDCLHLTTLDKCIRFKNAVDCLDRNFGFKLDLKSIQGMSSYCDSSSGFSVRDIRTFIKIVRKENVHFFHICGFEERLRENIGFTLSYFISDFLRKDE